MAMQMPQTRMDLFPLKGGLNLVTPPLSMAPGMCRDAQNFEIGIDGGYRRSAGYCRQDGRPSPADAVYYVTSCTFSGSVVAGNTITGATSGATAVVIAVEAGAIVSTKKVGTFTASEVLNVSGSPVATATSLPIADGASTQALHGQYKNLAADVYRADIQAVPGQGSILGVVVFNAELYAFRNKTGGLTAGMYKATASGWSLVTTPTLQPGGAYEFRIYNFGSGKKLYGVDGANKAFQFDGTTFTQITTGMATDTPQAIETHKNYLFLAFGNSLQYSAISNPLSWTPVLGAGEINLGDTITALKTQIGSDATGALAVYGRSSTRMLYGSSSSDFKLVTLDPNAGALARTVQHIGQTLSVDDRGVTTLETTSNYGNFMAASISAQVRPFIIDNKNRMTATCLSRDKNQYRIFFNNGRALYYTLGGGFMPMYFPHNFTCAFTGEDVYGNEVIYVGADNGYVYQMEKGTSFDGETIDAYLSLVFNHIKSPRVVKRYRKAAIEVSGSGYADFWMSAEIGYGDPAFGQVASQQLTTTLTAGRWDTGTWDVGVWDGRVLAPSEFELTGSAENISLRIAQSSDWHEALTFYSVMLAYTPRRQMR